MPDLSRPRIWDSPCHRVGTQNTVPCSAGPQRVRPARAIRWVSRGHLGQGDGYPSPTVIENAEEYRLTLEALADVEVQLGAVDETLCNLPEALRDVMRRALADNRDALLQEIAAFEELSGVSRGDPPAGSPGPSVDPSI